MVQCNRCHLQYIGETKRRLKDRFNEHRRPVDKTNITSKPTTVSEHFLYQPNHCHTDMWVGTGGREPGRIGGGRGTGDGRGKGGRREF